MSQPAPTDFDPDRAADTARDVLSAAKYQEFNRPPSLRERIFDWIIELITDVLRALSSGGGRGVFAWVIIGLFLVAILYLLRRLLQNLEPLTATAGPAGPDISIEAGRSADEWLAAARTAEGRNQWREGLRCRHRSVAVLLAENNLIDGDPGQTAREIDRQARPQLSDVADELAAATRIFEEVWYGHRPAGPDPRDEFEQAASVVRAHLSGQRPLVGAQAAS